MEWNRLKILATFFIRLADDWNAERTISGSIEGRYLNTVVMKGLQSVEDSIENVSNFFRFWTECRDIFGHKNMLASNWNNFIKNPEALQMAVMVSRSWMSPRHLDGIG